MMKYMTTNMMMIGANVQAAHDAWICGAGSGLGVSVGNEHKVSDCIRMLKKQALYSSTAQTVKATQFPGMWARDA